MNRQRSAIFAKKKFVDKYNKDKNSKGTIKSQNQGYLSLYW